MRSPILLGVLVDPLLNLFEANPRTRPLVVRAAKYHPVM